MRGPGRHPVVIPTVSTFSIEGLLLDRDRFLPGRIEVRGDRLVEPGRGEATWRLEADELLVPGFYDHHTHLAGSNRPPRGPRLAGAASRKEMLEKTASWLRAHSGSTPVIGEGFDESCWDDPRAPHRAELDRIEPARPLVLRRVCGHLAVANSAAWRALDPSGAEAEPESGLLKESYAMGLSQRWPPSAEEVLEGAVRGQERALAEGVTGIDEMGQLEEYEAYLALQREGRLRLRVDFFFPIREQDRLARERILPGGGSGRLCAAGLKGFLDGSFGARTAAVSTPYEGGRETGMLLWETAEIAALARRGARAGFDLALHAIGDRAVDQAIETFRDVRGERFGGRLRIEHAEQCADDAIGRAEAAGLVWSMQPNFTARWQGGGGLYESLLGRERALRLNRYRSLSRSGRLLFGSDTMPLGPLLGIRGALGHPDPGERLGAAETLRAYGPDGLRAGEEVWAVGKAADLVVLRIDGEDPERSLRDGSARVVWTAAAGRPVWTDEAASAPAALRGDLR